MLKMFLKKKIANSNYHSQLILKNYFMSQHEFLRNLTDLINQASLENMSDTPDYILAEYLFDCLVTYQNVVKKRDEWFGVDMWSANKLKSEK